MLTTFAISAAAITAGCQIATTTAYCVMCGSIAAALLGGKKK